MFKQQLVRVLNTKVQFLIRIMSGFILSMAPLTSLEALSISDAVRHTIETNPEAEAAKNELEARKFEVKQARAGYLPSVSVDAGIGREERDAPATGNERAELTRRELGVTASQLVFDGFATSNEIKRQKSRVESSKYGLASIQNQLALQTAEVYIEVMRQAELLDLARSTLWEHQNIYDQMKIRFDTGVGSKADFDQIASRLALANANMIVAQNNFADTQSNFHRLTGLYPTLESMSRPKITKALPQNRDAALDLALADHPVLKSAAADLEAARRQYKAAAGAYYPRVSIEAQQRWDDNIGGIEGSDTDTLVALRVQYDLFRGGANKARRKQSASLTEQARDIRNNSRRQIIQGLNLAWNAFEALSAQQQFLSAHVQSAISTKAAYKKQFNIGKRTLLDLLNTENEVVDSKRSLVNAEYDQIFAQYRIFDSMGVLLDSF